jgi:hypothetical protein
LGAEFGQQPLILSLKLLDQLAIAKRIAAHAPEQTEHDNTKTQPCLAS